MGLAPGSAVVPSAAVRLRRAPVHQHSRVVPLHRDAESELPLVAVVRHLRRRRLLRLLPHLDQPLEHAQGRPRRRAVGFDREREEDLRLVTTPDNAEFEVFSDSRRFFS